MVGGKCITEVNKILYSKDLLNNSIKLQVCPNKMPWFKELWHLKSCYAVFNKEGKILNI